jgi:hypothetical protein
MNAVALFEVADDSELGLVGTVGTEGPMVRHINKAHPFQGQQLPVVDIREFTPDHSSDSTSFTHESTPISNLGEAQSGVVLPSSNEGSANSNTSGVVCRPAWCHSSPRISESEAFVREIAAEDAEIIR